jgi:hypothetical protein
VEARDVSAPRAWVLNLDVEHELEDPGGYTRSRAMLEQLARAADRLRTSGFLDAEDVVLDPENPKHPGAGLTRPRGVPLPGPWLDSKPRDSSWSARPNSKSCSV